MNISVERGQNDIIIDSAGKQYVDLFSGVGSVWLGHANTHIVEAIAAQLKKISVVGVLPSSIQQKARDVVESFFPESHYLYGLYSTGMESAEFAIRVAMAITGKKGLLSFENNMHGKSIMSASLGWDNDDGVSFDNLFRFPFVNQKNEEEILLEVESVLSQNEIAVVFVEPIQGVGGGYHGSNGFYNKLYKLCQKHNTLLLFDEILTGFYRAGTPFYFSRLDFVPDIVLIGKGMGNGFPVSGVVVNRKFVPIEYGFNLTSTFSWNQVACAAVIATLEQIREQRPEEKVSFIEKAIVESLGGIDGIEMRIKGAMCILETKSEEEVVRIVKDAFSEGIHVNYRGKFLRLLPALTIGEDRLVKALEKLKTIIERNLS